MLQPLDHCLAYRGIVAYSVESFQWLNCNFTLVRAGGIDGLRDGTGVFLCKCPVQRYCAHSPVSTQPLSSVATASWDSSKPTITR